MLKKMLFLFLSLLGSELFPMEPIVLSLMDVSKDVQEKHIINRLDCLNKLKVRSVSNFYKTMIDKIIEIPELILR